MIQQLAVRPAPQQFNPQLSTQSFCFACGLMLVGLLGCSKSEPQAPVLTQLKQKADEPLPTATIITGTLSINGKQHSAESVLEFKPQSKIKLTVDVDFIEGGFTETAGVIKCVREFDGKKMTGSSAGLNYPAKDFDFELPTHAGEWDLLVLTSMNELVCSQKIRIVE